MKTLKTYSHLMHQRRTPTNYELVTSKLLYYYPQGFEVNVPIQKWYETHQKQAILTCSDWECFYDPRETTYTKYTTLQKQNEIYVDGILESIEKTNYDKTLSQECLFILNQFFAPLRYPWHGLQMVACYVAQMAPSSRIVIASLFQAGDEMRRIQRVAYRVRQLQYLQKDFASKSKLTWEKELHWQPLRKVIEKLLVSYDWTEAFVVLNLILKPLLDPLMLNLGDFIKDKGDYLTKEIFSSFYEDCKWHQDWSMALLNMLIQDNKTNKLVFVNVKKKWYPDCLHAVKTLAEKYEENSAFLSTLTSTYEDFLQPIVLDKEIV